MNKAERAQRAIIETCQDTVDHLQRLRDYATTPGDVWLARGELTKVNGLLSELEELLDQIKQADSE